MKDPTNGYQAQAETFIRSRSSVGAEIVVDWAAQLPKGAAVLDVGAGFGEPVTTALIAAGCDVWAIEPAPSMVAAFRDRIPEAQIACEPVETSSFHDRNYDGITMIGVLFLLPGPEQPSVIARLGRALRSGGRLLFSAPLEKGTWNDILTGRKSESLGEAAYRDALTDAGFADITTVSDVGQNNHYRATRY